MKRARFIAAARLELLAEVIYYNEAQPGLGARLTAAVAQASARAPDIIKRAGELSTLCIVT